jgi:hypothetical protein
MRLLSKLRGTKYSPTEFDVAQKMVSLLYFQLLVLLSAMAAPCSLVITSMLFYLNFKYV